MAHVQDDTVQRSTRSGRVVHAPPRPDTTPPEPQPTPRTRRKQHQREVNKTPVKSTPRRGRRCHQEEPVPTPFAVRVASGASRTLHHARSFSDNEFIEDSIRRGLNNLSPSGTDLTHATPSSTIRLHPSDIAACIEATPHAGPHSPIHSKKKTVTNPKRSETRALDVWPFFEFDKCTKERFCIICK